MSPSGLMNINGQTDGHLLETSVKTLKGVLFFRAVGLDLSHFLRKKFLFYRRHHLSRAVITLQVQSNTLSDFISDNLLRLCAAWETDYSIKHFPTYHTVTGEYAHVSS